MTHRKFIVEGEQIVGTVTLLVDADGKPLIYEGERP